MQASTQVMIDTINPPRIRSLVVFILRRHFSVRRLPAQSPRPRQLCRPSVGQGSQIREGGLSHPRRTVVRPTALSGDVAVFPISSLVGAVITPIVAVTVSALLEKLALLAELVT
jgi:hypothetical protein